VNIPATVAGVSETISARSRFLPFCEPLPVPSFFDVAKHAAGAKAFGRDDGAGNFFELHFHFQK